MAQLVLSIVLCVSAIWLAGVQGVPTAAVKNCLNDSTCSVVEGDHKKTEGGEKCGYLHCRPDEICEYPLVNCKEGVVCQAPPPKCFPRKNPITRKAQLGEKCGKSTCKINEMCLIILVRCLKGSTCKAPNPKCVPKIPKRVKRFSSSTSVSCVSNDCKPGYTCQSVTNYMCRRPRCRRPRQCVPIDPCPYTTCPKGYDCTKNANDPTVAECVPQNPCVTVTCDSGYTCVNVNVQCKKAPCPPITQCVPKNPCDSIACDNGYSCVPNENNPTVAVCVKNPCSNVACEPGYNCYFDPDECMGSDCPTNPRCLPINPCSYTTCLQGYACIPSVYDPTVAQCVPPKPPCATTLCEAGYRCENVNIQCIGVPCQPTAKCIPTNNPCEILKCSPGYICTQLPNDPKVAVCVLTPCASVHCGTGGTACMSFTKYCKYPPCSLPTAECVPLNDVNPCDLEDCQDGFICVTVPVTNCEDLFCETTRAECILPPKNPCDGTICRPGYVCTQTKNDPTVAECVRTPCATVSCRHAPMECMSFTKYCKYPPCSPPKAECVHINDVNPCDLVNCQDGFICVTVPVTNCEDLFCETTRAECIIPPKNPCDGTICKSGYVCTQKENDPTVAKCVLTPCATFHCGGGGTACMSFTKYCKYPPCSPPTAKCIPLNDVNPCDLVNCREGFICETVIVHNCEDVYCETTRAECKLPVSKVNTLS